MLSTVLIIDKRKELSTKYKKSLESPEITAIIASTLKDAMVIIPQLEPDMIIISDSIEEELAAFCQKIRALTFNSRPIIMALSKSADTSDRIKVLDIGADDFLSEPVSIEEFKTRVKAHLRRDIETGLDCKTLLPNLKLTKKILKRTITKENFAVLLIEIKNLKEYSSVYTELAADKLIQTFIAIAKSALEPADFIGQINEKEFVLVTNKYSAEKLANFLTFAFDTVVPKFYSTDDIKRGYMILKGEKYAGMRVNFVSISIGGLNEGLQSIYSEDALIENLRQIRNLSRRTKGSNYIFDRLKLSAKDSIKEESMDKQVLIYEKDDSLRYLLRTTLELQGYDVIENSNIGEDVFPDIVILDSGNDLEDLNIIKDFEKSKIIVTTTIHDKFKILDAGADLYLPKPYEISELIAWVEYFSKDK